MKFKWFSVIALAAMMVVPAMADEVETKRKKRKKGQQRGMAVQLIKKFKSVQLTDDQTAKVNELGKTADEKAKEIREKVGITNELLKERVKIQKSLKDSGKKGKELFAAINEQAGLNEDQIKGFKEINAIRTKLQGEIVALLTDEQKKLLPKRMQRTGKRGKNKKNKKKNE